MGSGLEALRAALPRWLGLAFALAGTAGFFAAALAFGWRFTWLARCFAEVLVAAFADGLERRLALEAARASRHLSSWMPSLSARTCLAAGLAARLVLARDDAFFVLALALILAFRRIASVLAPHVPAGVLATRTLTIQGRRRSPAAQAARPSGKCAMGSSSRQLQEALEPSESSRICAASSPRWRKSHRP